MDVLDGIKRFLGFFSRLLQSTGRLGKVREDRKRITNALKANKSVEKLEKDEAKHLKHLEKDLRKLNKAFGHKHPELALISDRLGKLEASVHATRKGDESLREEGREVAAEQQEWVNDIALMQKAGAEIKDPKIKQLIADASVQFEVVEKDLKKEAATLVREQKDLQESAVLEQQELG